jgi:hypothetical protein
MKSYARVAAAAVLGACLLAGCSHTVEGTAIRAGSPDSTAETRIPAPTTRTPSTTRSTPSRTPSAQPPGDALTTTCKQYTKLSTEDQQAVIEAIIEQEGSPLGPENLDIAKGLTDAACQFLPDVTVSEILLGTPPR